MKKDFIKLSSLSSVESAVKIMSEMNLEYLLIEEDGKLKGIASPPKLFGYSHQRLIIDCKIEPIITMSGEVSLDGALRIFEEKKVNFIVILNNEKTPIGVVNRERVVYSMCQELENSNREKEKYIAEYKRAEQELKKTQVQLIQAAKMAAMGELGAGITHELNQPLGGIKGFSQLILQELDPQSQVRKDFDYILEQVERMTKIVDNVRAFSRQTYFEPIPLNVNEVIEKTLMLVSQQLKARNIKLVKKLAENLPNINGDSSQLQQVFINMISNARYAVEEKNQGNGEIIIHSQILEKGESVEVLFIDNGIGISPDNISKIFDPFFTTRPTGKGVGLGLSISHGIIENHSGVIRVESKSGDGSTFRIVLPTVLAKRNVQDRPMPMGPD